MPDPVRNGWAFLNGAYGSRGGWVSAVRVVRRNEDY